MIYKKTGMVRGLLALLAMATFSLSLGTQQALASTATTSIGAVNVTVTTDKDNYEFGDTINANVKLENTSPVEINVDEIIPQITNSNISIGNVDYPATLQPNSTVEVEAESTTPVTADFEDWQEVELNGQNIRVGMRAFKSVIAEDSTLKVNAIEKNTPEYKGNWDKLDEKDKVERIGFLNLGVQKSNGDYYSNLDGTATAYVQIPNGWDEADVQALLVQAGKDEILTGKCVTIDGIRYLSFNINKLGTYAIMDKLSAEDIKEAAAASKETVETKGAKTGDLSIYFILALCAVALLLSVFCGNKARKSLFSLILCLGLVSSYAIVSKDNSAFAESGTGTVTNNITIAGTPDTLVTTVTISAEVPDLLDVQADGDSVTFIFETKVPDNWQGGFLTIYSKNAGWNSNPVYKTEITSENLEESSEIVVENLLEDTVYLYRFTDNTTHHVTEGSFITNSYL